MVSTDKRKIPTVMWRGFDASRETSLKEINAISGVEPDVIIYVSIPEGASGKLGGAAYAYKRGILGYSYLRSEPDKLFRGLPYYITKCIDKKQEPILLIRSQNELEILRKLLRDYGSELTFRI